MMIFRNSYFDKRTKKNLGYSYHQFKTKPRWYSYNPPGDQGANHAAATRFQGQALVTIERIKIRGTSYGVIDALNLFATHADETKVQEPT